MKNGLELLVKVPAECVGELFAKGLESVIARCTIEVPQAVTGTKETSQNMENRGGANKPEYKPRKVIKFRCDECGETNSLMCYRDDDGRYRITCLDCGKEFAFTENDLTLVKYNCNQCNEENWFFMPGNDGDMALGWDNCRKCKAENPLQYYNSQRCYGNK